MNHTVVTRDVDGSTHRQYKTVAGAIKRFESMVGYSIGSAIDEQFHDREVKPTVEDLTAKGGSVRAVSNYGCVVTIHFAKGVLII